MPTLGSLGEFGWLARLLPRLRWPARHHHRLVIGPGDDAGVLRWPVGQSLVATCDTLVEGIHFRRAWMPWEALGHKALAVTLSDCAAMGAVTPIAALVSLALPGDIPVNSVDKFYQGMNKLAQRVQVGLLGGDTVGSKRDIMVSVCVVGAGAPRGILTRAGARAGDLLWVTGPLGDAGAAVEILERQWRHRRSRPSAHSRHPLRVRTYLPLVRKQWYPMPRLAEGQLLGRKRLATSLIDCSDGLEPSVRILCQASQVGVELELERLPISAALRRWTRQRGTVPWEYALIGGEDYELIFTTAASSAGRVARFFPQARLIGRVLPKQAGVRGRLAGRTFLLTRWGYAHFRGD
ncbi:MAG: thiamine-phosphate kinase [Elusimicrobia bacterium]|nr:thiamine-phosphate kinase [Elusimicrobiota bacterium]